MIFGRLTPDSGGDSAKITPPKDWLRADGLVNEEGEVEKTQIKWERDGEGEYRVVVLDENGRAIADGGEREAERE